MRTLGQTRRNLFPSGPSRLLTAMSTIKQGFVSSPSPSFLSERMHYLSSIQQDNLAFMQSVHRPSITITLKDGRQVQGRAFQTTPLELLRSMPREVSEKAVVAKVSYSTRHDSPFSQKIASTEPEEHLRRTDQHELVDLSRPLEGDCTLELLTFEDKDGKDIFWHSSAHLLGQSLQKTLGVWLCHGPNIDHGFFYDSFMGDSTISQNDYAMIEQEVRGFVRQKQPFERIIVTKRQALGLFDYNPFKKELVESKVPEGALTTVYRCGTLVDLCTGPHLPSTDRVRGFKIVKNSSAYWLGDKSNDELQRVYGISFPRQGQLDEYLKQQEELARKDHRTIGPAQQLFNFSGLSPGSPFFLPHGATIYNRLIELMRSEYRLRGYEEVITPNIFNSQLWKMSGHYFKYSQNIYFMNEGHSTEEQGLKPMNCPGHCLIYSFGQKSYKDLPVRMADFGVLHRNQIHGALTGLTRVRRFQQDDAHIFCAKEQIMQEISGVLDLLDYVYSVFGFEYSLELSTRPSQFLGELSDWEQAEGQLREALDQFGREYKVNEGDGAFYGPKIDVKVKDVFQRWHQCGTIQLDFQLPVRFDLQYRTKDTSSQEHIPKQQVEQRQHSELTEQERYSQVRPLKHGFARPIIIHRAIFGSLERFMAILCEQTGGKWPFWLSPRQLKLIPISSQCEAFALKLKARLLLKGYSVEIDLRPDNLNKKIRKAQLQNFNLIGVIGLEEVQKGTVSIREREHQDERRSFGLDELAEYLESLGPPKSRLRVRMEEDAE